VSKKKGNGELLSGDPILDQLVHEKDPQEEHVKAALSDERQVLMAFERMKSLGIWNQGLVDIISHLYPQKKVQKELKRLAYLFSQKGVKTHVPQEMPAINVTTSIPSSPIKEAWSSLPIGNTRDRLGVLKLSKSAYIYIHFSLFEGIRYIFEGRDETFKELKRKIEGPFVSVPVEYLTFVISLAKEKTKDSQILAMVKDLEGLIKTKEIADMEKLFDFSPSLNDLSISYNHTILLEISKELIGLIYDQELFNKYLEAYKVAANPRIILDKFLIQTRKMEIIEEFIKEILLRRDDFIFALKEDLLLLSMANVDIPPSKKLLLKVFLEEDMDILIKSLELIFEQHNLYSQRSTSKIIMP